MRMKIGLISGVLAYLIFINIAASFGQEPAQQTEVMPAAEPEQEMQWVWGEVVGVDMQNKMLSVKYFNYDTDQEEEINIGINNETNFENIKSIDDIKPMDVLSIDYLVSPDGKNVARNISVDRPESTQGPQEGEMKEEKDLSPPVAQEDTEATQNY